MLRFVLTRGRWGSACTGPGAVGSWDPSPDPSCMGGRCGVRGQWNGGKLPELQQGCDTALGYKTMPNPSSACSCGVWGGGERSPMSPQKTGSGDCVALSWHLTWVQGSQLALCGETEPQKEQTSREPHCNLWTALSHQSLPKVWLSRC